MKIIHNSYPEAVFGDIVTGDVFGVRNELWMAIVEVLVKEENDEHLVNAVNLETGELEFFCEDDVVTVPDVAVTVR